MYPCHRSWKRKTPDLVGIKISAFKRLDLDPVRVDSAREVEAQS